MKRNLFLSLVLAAYCFFGAVQVKAQSASQMEAFDPEIQALAEEMKTVISQDPEKANSMFSKLIRKCKRNPAQFYRAGSYFLSLMDDLQFYAPAKQCSDKAYELNPQNIDILILKGEIAEKAKQWGAAGQAYEEVLSIDSTHVFAMKRLADTYKYVNPEVAKEYLFKLKVHAPEDTYADKTLGLIYFTKDEDFKAAAKSYDAYYKATPVDQVDLYSCGNYVNALFLNKSYSKAINVCKAVGPRDPENKIFKAVKFWSLVENYELQEAKEAMAYIVNKEYPDTVYGYFDYYYASRLNKDEGNLAEAIAYQKMAVERDSSRAAAWQVLNDLYQENKQYAEAVPVYKKYLHLMKELNRAQATDTFKLGYLYFTLAQIDSVKSKEWIKDGDDIFAYISESTPDSYLGPIFRARINNVGVTEPSDLVKGFYETASRLIGENLKYKTDKLECLQYLAFYDIQKDNYPEALGYIEQMEAIDPGNGWVKQVKGFVKSQIPQ